MKKFKVKLKINGEEIEHNKSVKYVGFKMDYLLRLNKHINEQLIKAKKRFQSLSRLFYSKYLNKRSKIICYMLFIRPILTYATPCWHNTSASAMESLRLFERKCLRICLKINRNQDCNYQKYISNFHLYNTANIPRIDNFIIKLIRNFYVASKKIKENEIIINLSKLIEKSKYEYSKKSGYISPQTFLNLDKEGYIQDCNNVPVLYHWKRNKSNKKILFNCNDDEAIEKNKIYSDSISNINKFNFERLNFKKYW